jgi:hypothetical protein
MMSDLLSNTKSISKGKRVIISGNTESSGKNSIARLFIDYKNVMYYKQYMAVDKSKMHPHIHIAKFFKYCNDNNIEFQLFKNYNTKLNYDYNVHIIRNILVSNFANLVTNEQEGYDSYIVYVPEPKECCIVEHQMLMESPNKCLKIICEYLKLPFKKISVQNKYLKSYNKYLTVFEYNVLINSYTYDDLRKKYENLHETLTKTHGFNYEYIPFDDMMKG